MVAMRGSDLINVSLLEELLEDMFSHVGGTKRDLDACALNWRRCQCLKSATGRSAKVPAFGGHADVVVGLFAERFPKLVSKLKYIWKCTHVHKRMYIYITDNEAMQSRRLNILSIISKYSFLQSIWANLYFISTWLTINSAAQPTS